MTKTKKQILEHLNEVPYTKKTTYKILGFLHAKAYIQLGELVNFKGRKDGEISLTFPDFMKWYNDDTFEKNVYIGIIEELKSELKDAQDEGSAKECDKLQNQISLLMDIYLKVF